MTDFKSRFSENLRTGAEALEDAGYDTGMYQAAIDHSEGLVSNWADTPEEALDTTLEEIQDEDQLFLYVAGDEFAEALQGERDVASLIERNLRGGVEVDEPMTDEPPYVDEPIPAFETSVRYVPDENDYWEVSTGVTKPPYTEEDTEQHLQNLVQAFDDAGIEVENKGSGGIEHSEKVQ